MILTNDKDKVTLYYHYSSLHAGADDSHNVVREYRKSGRLEGTDTMTHDDAIADIRGKTQDGFHVSEF